MTGKECGQVVKLTRTMNKCHLNTELSSLEETRSQFNGGRCAIKLGIDVHQDFYVVVMQEGGATPKPPQRFRKEAFLHWAAKLKREGGEVHAVYEACGFGFALQRQLSALSIQCHVVCPQKLDEQNKRVKTDGLDAKALCLRLDRFVQGNRAALALVRVPSEQEEQLRAIHRQREQLVKVRKRLEAQGRSLMVNHGLEPVQNWWKPRTFAALPAPQWMKELLGNNQPLLLALQERIGALTLQLQAAAAPKQPRGLGQMTSVIIDREIGDWNRFNNRRQIASYQWTTRKPLVHPRKLPYVRPEVVDTHPFVEFTVGDSEFEPRVEILRHRPQLFPMFPKQTRVGFVPFCSRIFRNVVGNPERQPFH